MLIAKVTKSKTSAPTKHNTPLAQRYSLVKALFHASEGYKASDVPNKKISW
jgi:hypothetical protein